MKKYSLSLILILLNLAPLSAHPHLWAQTQLEFEFDGNLCKGVWVTWDFDTFFSMSIAQAIDVDGNLFLDDEEIEALYHYGFKNLENYGYFVLIRVGNTRFTPKRVEQFTAWFTDTVLTYRFFIPLDKDKLAPPFFVAVFDTTFFTDISYKKPEVYITQEKEGSNTPQWKVTPNKNYPVYYNPRGAANDLTVYSKWQPGLETVYPQEIHVYF